MSLIRKYFKTKEIKDIFDFLQIEVKSKPLSYIEVEKFLNNLVNQYGGEISPILFMETEIEVSGFSADEWLLNKFDNFG